MAAGGSNRPWWLGAVIVACVVWGLGAYFPAISNVWVLLNVLTPAGQPSLATFPLAYPAVGVDANTLVSLVGLLFVIGGTTRWITYLTKANPGIAPNPGAAAPVQTTGAPVASRAPLQ
ncbi:MULTISPECIES: hypothetical protein [Mycolicibacter]|uniref:Transmembrane protein n=2 Tax=Mycolicibacter TaxID=1073531 RepID=A0ABU5XL95_9MYCO|nr:MULTISPECIES: hypothetical protein [unclassified Mycolicibacter]MEB3022959.1 hypothetical protein [Mycolicibacter sp. MYC098]MEB3033469.1 hypothetical protein [Mycolicibacter sp. MYC340]